MTFYSTALQIIYGLGSGVLIGFIAIKLFLAANRWFWGTHD